MSGSLEAAGLGKRLPRYRDDRPHTLKQHILRGWRGTRPIDHFWAVSDVSFQIEPGRMLGVIGHNGSGKSTLLRLLGGVMRADSGTVRRRGRVSGLLELNAGLHPDLSGRDNIMINGVIAGLSRREVAARYDEIVAFSELGEFIESPVRTYSAGMKMRLGFSVAAHVEPGILLIDEVLSVGDMAFQQKGLDRVRHYKEQGSAIVLVTHDLSQVEALCDRVLWLRGGKVASYGEPAVVIGEYRSEMSSATRNVTPSDLPSRLSSGGVLLEAHRNRFGSQEIEIGAVRLLDQQGRPVTELRSGDPLAIELLLNASVRIEDAVIGIAIANGDDSQVLNVNSGNDNRPLPTLDGEHRITLRLDRLDLSAGEYHLDVGVYEGRWAHAYDYHWHGYPLKIVSDGHSDGMLDPPRRWEFGE